jgi:hypothetical protein
MKNWIELLTDAASIRAIFGQVVPILVGVDLHEIVLHRDGPRVLLRFDLSEFPEEPPSKWVTANFNRVQVKLLAVGVKELNISGLQTSCQLDLTVFEDDSLIHILAKNDVVCLKIAADELFIDNISAYKNEKSAKLGSGTD